MAESNPDLDVRLQELKSELQVRPIWKKQRLIPTRLCMLHFVKGHPLADRHVQEGDITEKGFVPRLESRLVRLC